MINGNHNHDDHDSDSADRDLVRRLAAGDPGGPSLTSMLDGVAQAAETDGLLDVAWAPMDSPVGPLTLAATPEGVVRIEFGRGEQLIEDLATKVSPRVLRAPKRLDPLRRELDEYFVGKRHVFEVPVDWRLSHGFRLTALQELFDVPYGHTVSYKQLAERAGSPRASRAIGGAMATNPVPIVVPCHRVLRTGGDLGGYGGGLDAKRWLLRLEGALLA